jgi:hypothetical protein
MGKSEIRTVCKVNFDKPAAEQPCLHVSLINLKTWIVVQGGVVMGGAVLI